MRCSISLSLSLTWQQVVQPFCLAKYRSSRCSSSSPVTCSMYFSSSSWDFTQVLRSARITSTSRPASRGESLPVIFSSSALGRFLACASVQHSSILNPLRHSWQFTSSRNCSILMFSSLVSNSSTRSRIRSGDFRCFTRKPWIIDIANLPSGSRSAKAFARSARWQNRRTIFSIWYLLARPISKASSVLPGRSRAGSRRSLKLVVMMMMRPSWLRTPSIALRKPEKVRELFLPVFLRSLKMESTSSSRMIDFLGAELSSELRWKSLMLSEQLRKQIENLTSPASACASELLPVPGGPQSRQLRLQGMPIETYHSSLSMNSRMSARIYSRKLSWKMTDSSLRGRFSLEVRQQPWLFSQMIILLLSSSVSARLKTCSMQARTNCSVSPKTLTFLMNSILRHSVVSLASPRSKTTSKECSPQETWQVPSCGSNSIECFFNLLPIEIGGTTLWHRRASSGAMLFSSMRHFTKTQQESSSLSISTKGKRQAARSMFYISPWKEALVIKDFAHFRAAIIHHLEKIKTTAHSLASGRCLPILNLARSQTTLVLVRCPALTNFSVASLPRWLLITSLPPGCLWMQVVRSYTPPKRITIFFSCCRREAMSFCEQLTSDVIPNSNIRGNNRAEGLTVGADHCCSA